MRELSQTPLLRHVEFDKVLQKEPIPPFRPPADHLNCDPSLELEEMIVEAKPLHKKKKRLAKQRSAQKDSADSSTAESNYIKEFIVYNRYKEIKKRAMEMKEKEWQDELNTLMANSAVNNLSSIREVQNEQQLSAAAANVSSERGLPSDRSSQMGASSSIKNNADLLESQSKSTKQPPSPANKDIEFIDRTPSPKSNLFPSKK